IHKLFLSLANQTADNSIEKQDTYSQKNVSYAKLFNLATVINRTKDVKMSLLNIFLLGCSSRVLSDPTGFIIRYKENKKFRAAYQYAVRLCSDNYSKSMLKTLSLKGIDLENL
ncbi:MAG: hypothetical protein PVI90_15835, partial [Desulfobacteraceae bacterium]